jgi:hypothetical protein
MILNQITNQNLPPNNNLPVKKVPAKKYIELDDSDDYASGADSDDPDSE